MIIENVIVVVERVNDHCENKAFTIAVKGELTTDCV